MLFREEDAAETFPGRLRSLRIASRSVIFQTPHIEVGLAQHLKERLGWKVRRPTGSTSPANASLLLETQRFPRLSGPASPLLPRPLLCFGPLLPHHRPSTDTYLKNLPRTAHLSRRYTESGFDQALIISGEGFGCDDAGVGKQSARKKGRKTR